MFTASQILKIYTYELLSDSNFNQAWKKWIRTLWCNFKYAFAT